MKGYMSVQEAAEALGVTRGRVAQLILRGQLKAEKIGAYWAVDEESVMERKRNPPPAGRRWPKKNQD